MDEIMTWEFQLALALVVVAFLVLAWWKLGPPFVAWVRRLIWWHRVKPYSACYITYRDNVRGLK